MGVRGRVAIVTGSGQGIGEGIARRLSADAAKVVINDIFPEKVERVVNELAKFGITANAVAPALIDTPLFRGLKEEIQERLLKTVPVGRIGTPEDVAQAVAFFAADESSYIAGQTLYVCGGRSVGAP